jgi:molecular chaperone GrpE
MDNLKVQGSGQQPGEAEEQAVRAEGPRKAEDSSEPESLREAPPAPLPGDLTAAYEKLSKEKEELYDRLVRKQAELENVRKRVQREKEEYLQHATGDLIRALLPVLDGFERALKQRDPNVPEEFYRGVELIYGEFLGVLSRAGVTPIPTEGKLFDPHLHQAVETVQAPGRRDQEIVEELQRGYKLKHRLLRPAIVKVAVSKKEGDTAPPLSPPN